MRVSGRRPPPRASAKPTDDRTPLSAAEFGRLMAAVGPFEARPGLAVALSGGADSMALAVLADAWARRRGGRLTALTVDHGLRPASAAEARRVSRWMLRLGVAHRVLSWHGAKPVAGVQAAARAARYRLMTAWCREAGVLHLLLAHHLQDQAETFLLRLAHGSGGDGLAAMAAVVETPAVRLVRPLLGTAPERLRETLRRRRQEWIEDPSNQDPAYARTRVRRLLPGLGAAGLGVPRLAAAAARLGHARGALEVATQALLAGSCAVHPAGFARVDGAVLAAAPAEIALRALARIIACIGGAMHAPSRQKLERVHAAVVGQTRPSSRTLGGCRIVAAGAALLVCREARHRPEPVPAVAGSEVVWDRRFVIELAADRGGADPVARIARLGRRGWSQVVAERPELRACALPPAVRPSLPALWDGAGVAAVPHVGYVRDAAGGPPMIVARVAFRPLSPLSPMGFFLA